MRRAEREITDREEILDIMKRCDSCSIALFDEEYPYIVPLNFGVEVQDKNVCLLFHGASTGTKLELIEKNKKAAFEMSTSHKLLLGEVPCKTTMEYESVCGNGVIRILKGKGRTQAMQIIMNHYEPDRIHDFQEKEINAVTLFKLEVNRMSGKKR